MSMRKFAFVLIMMAFAFTSMAMAAQETEKIESSWGFEIGVGLATLEVGDGDGAAKNYLGFEGGVNYSLEKWFFEVTISHFKKAYDDYTTSCEAVTLKANIVPVDGFYMGIHYGIRPSRTKWNESGNVYSVTINGPGIQTGLCLVKNIVLEYDYSWIRVKAEDYSSGHISSFGLKYFF